MLGRSSVLLFFFLISSRERKNPLEISRVTFYGSGAVTRPRERYSLGYWKTDRADWKQCKGRAARSENREIYLGLLYPSSCCRVGGSIDSSRRRGNISQLNRSTFAAFRRAGSTLSLSLSLSLSNIPDERANAEQFLVCLSSFHRV